MNNELAVRELVESWAQAVRDRNIDSILAFHAADIVMYDVPYPFASTGMQAYRESWDLFFRYTKPGVFDFNDMTVIAGEDVAFVYATMQCADKSKTADYTVLDFRLTVGLKKVKGQWMILHEHHSVPAE